MAYRESYAGKINRKLNKKLHVVEVAAGRQKADLVLKNATYVNVFCNELSHGDIAVAEGLIAGMGEHYEGALEVDMGGKLVLPGFVDAHIHLESSLVSPKEFANAVASCCPPACRRRRSTNPARCSITVRSTPSTSTTALRVLLR